jgi:hypothetical protein
MLDVNTPAFRQQYPNGATVYDRTGRRIRCVVAYNPETGEVIRNGASRIVGAVLRVVRRRPQIWDFPAEFRSHGFWPAPLRVERIVFDLTVGDAHGFVEGQLITVNNVSYAVASVTQTTIAAID